MLQDITRRIVEFRLRAAAQANRKLLTAEYDRLRIRPAFGIVAASRYAIPNRFRQRCTCALSYGGR